jgi:hypothetical protein
MKAIKVRTIITSIRSKNDRSLGISLSTPELTVEERSEFMNLQSVECMTLFEPISEKVNMVEIKSEVSTKTQSQRLRAVIFILWKQEGENGTFEEYYRIKTEQIIDWLKTKIND